MVSKFDLVAIGTGSAASAVASRCGKAGWKVAIVDSRPFGGTCALRGCDPKKVLVGAAEATDRVRRMSGKGIDSKQLRIDWQQLMHFKRTFTEPVPQSREEAFLKAGIEPFHGRAQFIGPNSVQVGDRVLEARYFLIATGQRPADLGIPGSEHFATSDEFLELDDLPGRILFIGGGYIAFEFAHIAVRAGSQVTILHRGGRPLPLFDSDLVDMLVQKSRDLGIDIQVGTEARSIDEVSGHLAVHASCAQQSRVFEADMVVHAGGRVPEIDDLRLETARVEWDRKGVKVNEFLQSVSNPAVYAAGDAADSGGPPLTPVAGYEGVIVAANLVDGNHRKPDYTGIPTVVFTTPPLASVGMSEETAHVQGLRFYKKHERTSDWYSSRRVGETCSGYKVLVEEKTDRILGAHLLGDEAGEVINLFALAIRSGMRATDLKHTLFAYPTHGSDVAYML
ncbi:MAG TPA: NAD(P)/FAD-dependent oxidoreductase [Candidatus Acidoferrales bacterium]|nr:NAD(P)/FAD-dependent oxidoreductase [Candidatus Acidoferrales bacterium]